MRQLKGATHQESAEDAAMEIALLGLRREGVCQGGLRHEEGVGCRQRREVALGGGLTQQVGYPGSLLACPCADSEQPKKSGTVSTRHARKKADSQWPSNRNAKCIAD